MTWPRLNGAVRGQSVEDFEGVGEEELVDVELLSGVDAFSAAGFSVDVLSFLAPSPLLFSDARAFFLDSDG